MNPISRYPNNDKPHCCHCLDSITQNPADWSVKLPNDPDWSVLLGISKMVCVFGMILKMKVNLLLIALIVMEISLGGMAASALEQSLAQFTKFKPEDGNSNVTHVICKINTPTSRKAPRGMIRIEVKQYLKTTLTDGHYTYIYNIFKIDIYICH